MNRRRTLAALLACGAQGRPLWAAPAGDGPVLTPQAFGAVGDGQADDTAALQRLLDQAAATAAEVHITPGVYRADRYLLVRHGVRAILGRGGVLQFVPGQLNAGLLLAGLSHGQTRNVRGLRIEGLLIDASARRQPVNAVHGLNSSDCRIVGNRISGLHAGAGVLIQSPAEGREAATGTLIEDNQIEGDTGVPGTEWWGIRLNATPRFAPGIDRQDRQWLAHHQVADAELPITRHVLRGNTVQGGYYGIWLMAARDCTVQGNRLQQQVRNLSVQDCSRDNRLLDNDCGESLSSAIHLAYGASGNEVRGNRVHGRRAEGEGLLQCYVAVQDNRFIDNQVRSEGAAKYLAYCAIQARGNEFRGNLLQGAPSRAAVAIESAWDGLSLSPSHYAFLKGPLQPRFAWAGSQDNRLIGNSLQLSGEAPALRLAQLGGADTALTDCTVQANQVQSTGQGLLLQLQEAQAGALGGLRLVGNRFDPQASSSRFVLPRGAAHCRLAEDNTGQQRWLLP